MYENSLPWIVLASFVLAACAPWIDRAKPPAYGSLLLLYPLAATGYFLSSTERISSGNPLYECVEFFPAIGVRLSFYLDGLSLLFGLLICFIGALVIIHSQGYLAGHHHLGRFYAFILFFLGSMLGLVLAGNLISLYLFWELTSLASFFLIGFEHSKEASRKAAWQALLVTSFGGLALLAGLILLGTAAGTFELPELLRKGSVIKNDAHYVPALILILLGAFTKSAQWPFHFWLPAAMEAPAPVSAYLHSATMVKAGVFLLARFSPILADTSLWTASLVIFGSITILTGAALALLKTDAKQALAYSTVAVLGALTVLIGIGSPAAIQAMVVYLLAHALYKGALFLAVGNVDHETGERSLDRLSGLAKAMPLTAAATALAALSMAGVPPALGYIGKEAVFEAIQTPSLETAWLLPIVFFFFSASAVAVAAYCALFPFWIGRKNPLHTRHEHSKALTLPPLILGISGLVLIFFPHLLANIIIDPAAQAILRSEVHFKIKLWHGLNLTLLLSSLALIFGALTAIKWRFFFWTLDALPSSLRTLEPSRLYEKCIFALNYLAKRQTDLLQNGSLHHYITVVLFTMLLLAGGTLYLKWLPGPVLSAPRALPHEWSIAILITAAWVAIVFLRKLLAVIAALGAAGYGVALMFMLFGGADLAITQFAVETLSVILFVLVLYRLPGVSYYSSRGQRLFDFSIAACSGLLFTTLLIGATREKPFSGLSDFFLANALPLAHGRNVVNVIIVDFRALDTLGEISVLSIAAIGIFALLKLKNTADLNPSLSGTRPAHERYPSIILFADIVTIPPLN